VYEGGLHVRTLHTPHHPTALSFVHPGGSNAGLANAENVLMVAESNQLSIWDLRAGEKWGCMQRVVVDWTGSSIVPFTHSPNSSTRLTRSTSWPSQTCTLCGATT
jgi:hypothetical protein